MTEFQELLYEALCELGTFLDAADIPFFLRGGSAMGAVKYHGFVPWDDDADIAIDRELFNKFLDLIDDFNQASAKFVIYSYKRGDTIHSYCPQLFLKESERAACGLHANNALGLLLIDIFPLDGAPSAALARSVYFFRVYALRALAGLHTYHNYGEETTHTTSVVHTLRILDKLQVHRLYSQVSIYEKLDRLFNKQSHNPQYKGTVMAFNLSREVFPSKVWGEGVMAAFEDSQFRIPADYDTYLKQMYGENYLTEEPSDDEKAFKCHVC